MRLFFTFIHRPTTQRIDAWTKNRGSGTGRSAKNGFTFIRLIYPKPVCLPRRRRRRRRHGICVPLLWINDGDAFFHLLRVHLRNKLAKFLYPLLGIPPRILRHPVLMALSAVVSICRHLDHRFSRLVFRWMGSDSGVLIDVDVHFLHVGFQRRNIFSAEKCEKLIIFFTHTDTVNTPRGHNNDNSMFFFLRSNAKQRFNSKFKNIDSQDTF